MKTISTYLKSISWTIIMLVAFLLPSKAYSGAQELGFLSGLVHIFMFAVFYFFLVFDQYKSSSRTYPLAKHYLYAFILSVFLGVIIEVLQKILDFGRSAEISDVLFDIFGSLFALAALIVWFSYSKKRLL